MTADSMAGDHRPPAHDSLQGVPASVVERFGLDRLPFAQRGSSLHDLIDLGGIRAVVTGGGGESLGQAICSRLAGLGARVAVLGTTASRTKAVAGRITAAGGEAFSVVADVTDWDGIHTAMDGVAQRLGGIDLLVNNAGGSLRTHGPFVGLSNQDIDRVIAVNLSGVLYSIRAALTHMIPAGAGRVINVASEGGKTGMRNLAVYNASKAGALGATRNLAHELPEYGVSIVAVCPGIMVGPYTIERFRDLDGRPGARTIDETMNRISLGRVSLPEEVANMVAFLASPAGAYVHGTAVSVGGGISD
ncbi:MAG TPA: SDR family NAD(P)-dependent oxidoreductase [Acidimicrobiales bacterium]|nr:SDR family NAD(P)-dependent oxidoreductase [Acidimicrobiales bacterium]